nr:hypothetical protein [Tanacetum cinerariifolium]
MTSYETFQGLSLVVQLIPAVIALAAWGLRPLLHAFRILFLQKNDNSWAKSKEHQVMKSYIRPLLLWGGVVLICRVLKPVILHSSTKPSCQATASEFCSFIVYSFGICILLIEQLTRQLEDQENVTDLVARLRMQSNALRSGALLQNL